MTKLSLSPLEIRRSIETGKTISMIAKEQGVSRQWIHEILKKHNLMRPSTIEEIVSMIKRNISVEGECWLPHFLHSRQPRITIDKKYLSINRILYEEENGKIPEKKILRRTCQNARCVNPAHFVLSERGAFVPHGSKNPNAKLNESQVIEIRELIQQGATNPALAERFGVSTFTISKIRNYQYWRHVTDEKTERL